MHRCVVCVCAAGSTRVEQSLEVSIYSLLLRTLCCVGDLQNLVEYHRVNLSMMPPHVAAPVVLVCAEPLAVERGGRMFCVVASLPRRSLVEVLSWAALWRGLSHGPQCGSVMTSFSSLGPPFQPSCSRVPPSEVVSLLSELAWDNSGQTRHRRQSVLFQTVQSRAYILTVKSCCKGPLSVSTGLLDGGGLLLD